MSERKALVDRAILKMAEFNQKNMGRIRAMQEGGGSNLYREGYNPDAETMRKVVEDFASESEDIQYLLVQINQLEPDENPVHDIALDGTEMEEGDPGYPGDPYLY